VLTVACVLKSGGDFRPEHVHALRDGVARNLALPHRFVCLTDIAVDCETRLFWKDWPGWWSKLEVFRTGLFVEPTVYFDLDTVIVGPLDDLVLGHRFTVLDDWLHPGEINSSLMAWEGDLGSIYRAFERDPARFIQDYRTRGRWGDQDFIRDHTPIEPDRWQDRHPGKMVSFKKHVLPMGRIPDGAVIVSFHGRPRPWQIAEHQRSWFEPISEVA
jgi:hypothetical protein